MKKEVYLYFTVCFFLLLGQNGIAQSDSSSWKQKAEVTISGFVDAFYAFDANQPSTNYRFPYLVNHNRHNELNINLGLVKVAMKHAKYRSAIAFQAGTYVYDNYSAESGAIKNLNECNVGISLTRKNNLWLDAGILNSHIGFESAISIDNWNLTRSLLAELSPYYMAGAKLTFNPNKKLELAALVCNGWQRIQRVTDNSLPSFGTQLKYIPSEKVTLNWSTFAGTDDSDFKRRMRYFSNFYGQFLLSARAGIIVGFDMGIQQKTRASEQYNYWYSPVIIARYKIMDKLAAAARYEYYEDLNNVIISSATTNGWGFQTSGYSLNLDYTPVSAFAFRIEGKWLSSAANIYPKENKYVNNNLALVASIAMRFEK